MSNNRRLVVAIVIAGALVLLTLSLISFVVLNAPVIVPRPSPSPSPTSLSPSPSSVPPTNCDHCEPITRPPTLSPSPTLSPRDSCICAENEQPIYDTFPHPDHTDESYALFNFFNHNGVDSNGEPLTVWVTVTVTADADMQAADGRFRTAYNYVYLDAARLDKGEAVSLTIPRALTAEGRLGGGRIYIYYEDPAIYDTLRNTRYGGQYPTQAVGREIIPITDENGAVRTPTNQYTQLLEFTLDVQDRTRILETAFIDYDLSAVDQIALPVYIFGGYDTTTLPGATTGNNNNGFPCGKAYVGCSSSEQTVQDCPTQLKDITERGATCLAAFPYCELPSNAIQDLSRWNAFCHQFDEYAEGFGITQQLLDTYLECVRTNNILPPCPPIIPPIVSTPTNVIYGCVGQFLLENHCLLDGSRFTQSHLDGTQCSAINRGLCFTPDYDHVPEPCGLSCARVPCANDTGSLECLYPCDDYDTCFGALCSQIDRNLAPICTDETRPVCKSRVSTCNDSTAGPYTYPQLLRNEYAEWVRAKGQRFYGFSLDEEVGGGNQQCLFSTQLDVVVFPSCGGNF